MPGASDISAPDPPAPTDGASRSLGGRRRSRSTAVFSHLFDLDAELKIWLGGDRRVVKQFGTGVDVYEVQALWSGFVAR